MSLAVGVEESQAVETLVVLREAAEAEEESTVAHFHQHAPLVHAVCRQGFGHLDHLGWGLRFPFNLAARGLRSSLLGGGRLRRGGRDEKRTRVRRDLGG